MHFSVFDLIMRLPEKNSLRAAAPVDNSIRNNAQSKVIILRYRRTR